MAISASIAYMVLISVTVRDRIVNGLDFVHHCSESLNFRSVHQDIPTGMVRQCLLVFHRFPAGILRLCAIGNLSHLQTGFP